MAYRLAAVKTHEEFFKQLECVGMATRMSSKGALVAINHRDDAPD